MTTPNPRSVQPEPGREESGLPRFSCCGVTLLEAHATSCLTGREQAGREPSPSLFGLTTDEKIEQARRERDAGRQPTRSQSSDGSAAAEKIENEAGREPTAEQEGRVAYQTGVPQHQNPYAATFAQSEARLAWLTGWLAEEGREPSCGHPMYRWEGAQTYCTHQKPCPDHDESGREATVTNPEGMWVCLCNYGNLGPICTHCGLTRENALRFMPQSPPARESS